MLDERHLMEFAERGYLVIPQAIPEDLVTRATKTIDAVIERKPPEPEVRGNHFYFPACEKVPHLLSLLTESPAFAMAEQLTGSGTLGSPPNVQIALNIPPFDHRPGGPHIDAHPCAPDVRPGTFTLLVGVLMSDQTAEDSGNVWVWPGTHYTHAEYFSEHGPGTLREIGGHVPIKLPQPEQILGRAGDLVLAHYLLGHNIGGNMSGRTRRAVYLRLTRHGHEQHWENFLRDPWLDYPPIAHLIS